MLPSRHSTYAFMRRLALVMLCFCASFAFGQAVPPSLPGQLPSVQPPLGDLESEPAHLAAPCSGGHAVDPDRAAATRPRGADRDALVVARSSGSAGASPWAGPCSSADFAAATGAAFIELVATSTDDCLDELWSFDGDVEVAIAPANVLLIASAIESEALDLLGNSERLRRMSYFYQIAFYHEFYQSSVTYDDPTFSAAIQAMVTIGQQPELITGDPPVSLL